jgi:hypothetical protein
LRLSGSVHPQLWHDREPLLRGFKSRARNRHNLQLWRLVA